LWQKIEWSAKGQYYSLQSVDDDEGSYGLLGLSSNFLDSLIVYSMMVIIGTGSGLDLPSLNVLGIASSVIPLIEQLEGHLLRISESKVDMYAQLFYGKFTNLAYLSLCSLRHSC
jgi:hypothetical protein